MPLGDVGAGIGGGGGVVLVLYTIHLLKPYFNLGRRNGSTEGYRGDSPKSIRDMIQEQRDKDILRALERFDQQREKDQKEMMECLNESRDILRDISRDLERRTQ